MIRDQRSDHFNATLDLTNPTSPQTHQFSASWSDRRSDSH